ncbi:MAG: CapA family protein [Thermoleophilia bacterium]|nr:CapA family protein [Gaiellaceae bacterium]MDW8337627.1 CapA family protein [Thermoleophilia bacterium]
MPSRPLLTCAFLALLAAPALVATSLEGPGGALSPQETAVSAARASSVGSSRQPLGSGRRVVLAFAGDIHFEGLLAGKLRASPATLLAPIAPVLERADLAVANLETAVTERGEAAPKTYTFRAPPIAFAALRAGGIDVVSMANNHGMDFGLEGLRDSLAAAKRYRFPVVGIGRNARQAYAAYRVTINGQRIAVLGATQVLDDHLIAAWTAGPGKPGLASAKDAPRLVRAVREARTDADTVVVFLHWGVELMECPTPDQRSLARALVRAGADVVVGGHAHRVQGAGRLGRALVGYGLGNFVWYGTSEPSTRSGVLLVTVTGRRVDSYRWLPARIVDGVPRPMTGAERASALRSWRALRACTGLRP